MNRILLVRNILNQYPLKKGAEIGTFKGEFSKEILNMWNGTLYMVDVWNELGDEYIDASNHKNFEGGVYGNCMENIKGFEDRAIMIRAKSEIAAHMFEDESLDFVYIDANHAYDFVKQDIELWYPKVKTGGWVLGHDYIKLDWTEPPFTENGKDKHIWVNDGFGGPYTNYAGIFGVNPAVDEFCQQNGYTPGFTEEFFSTWYFRKK